MDTPSQNLPHEHPPEPPVARKLRGDTPHPQPPRPMFTRIDDDRPDGQDR